MGSRPSPATTKETIDASQNEVVPFASLAQAFPQLSIDHTDLQRLGFGDDEIARLSPDDMAAIAQTMRQHLIHEWLPQELHFHVMEHLERQEQNGRFQSD